MPGAAVKVGAVCGCCQPKVVSPSARHCQSILYSYRDTQYIDEAMDLMAKDYDKLGLKLPADNTRKVIAASSSGK